MANIKQQKKRVLTNEIARQRNQAIRARLRTEAGTFNKLVEAGDKEGAEAQFRSTSRLFDKAVTKGTIHRNNAANKKSNMARALNKIGK